MLNSSPLVKYAIGVFPQYLTIKCLHLPIMNKWPSCFSSDEIILPYVILDIISSTGFLTLIKTEIPAFASSYIIHYAIPCSTNIRLGFKDFIIVRTSAQCFYGCLATSVWSVTNPSVLFPNSAFPEISRILGLAIFVAIFLWATVLNRMTPFTKWWRVWSFVSNVLILK